MAASTIDQELILAIQAYLKQVGIDAEIKILDSAAMTTARTKGWENGILLQGVGVSTASYIQAMEVDGASDTKAYSALVSPEYSALLKKASSATDTATIKSLSEQLAKLVQDEAIVTPWVVESRSAVFSKKVTTDLDAISIWFWNPGDAWIGQ
jgi:ABC-type transport system substrate-binding protein